MLILRTVKTLASRSCSSATSNLIWLRVTEARVRVTEARVRVECGIYVPLPYTWTALPEGAKSCHELVNVFAIRTVQFFASVLK